MRALFTLTKRQIVDNAVYFLAAIIFSTVLIIAIISITLSEDITYLSLYTVSVIVITPILFGIGSYILGVIQTCFDRTNGVTTVLSVLPVTHVRIFLARLIPGTLIILTLLGPLAITGAILWKFLGPPHWLYYDWLTDTFIGLSLSSLACYCLGLIAARRADTFASALRALPLVPILILLIVIKGFGWPLLAVLLPLLAVLLLRCFEHDSNRSMAIITTGFTTLLLLSVPLSFGRNFSDELLITKIKANTNVSPSGLLPLEFENDPNVVKYSTASSRVSVDCWRRCIVRHLFGKHWYELFDNFEVGQYFLENTGIIQYFESLERGRRFIYSPTLFGRPYHVIHLDHDRGLLVYYRTIVDRWDDEFTWHWNEVVTLYAGPNGASTIPDNTLGRFVSPIVNYRFNYIFNRLIHPPTCIIYDEDYRCFFAVDFKNQTVRRGPEVQDSSFRPVNISPKANSVSLGGGFSRPSDTYTRRGPMGALASSGYFPVVDQSGQIYLLDPNTLELKGPVGHLPRPKTLLGRASSKPIDILDYFVRLVAIIPYDKRPTYGNFPAYDISDKTGEYLGLVAGSLSRQGLWTSVAVFDKDGKKIKGADSKSTFFDMPGGPALTITKYIFESLHPPVLTLASFFTAYSFEARSTYGALFLMPNSFVAMARDYEGNIFYMLLIVLLLMLPGILLAGLLGWRIERDATTIGLSRNARRLWLAGTLVFGLVGYITYRLTRPKVALVTCANCGKPRRTDTDKCHRCGSKWDVPELTPPAWRVLNGAE
ncbi:MAG: hypothetical protein A2Z38_02840 [Planctomycetes bacterium RBG_19FT_COMBO_48_8]|nr:MAG: hypothetical protein A2Z38_02840 [Planctomycetes bacterium RBG_19FT_COMBO_48_8]